MFVRPHGSAWVLLREEKWKLNKKIMNQLAASMNRQSDASTWILYLDGLCAGKPQRVEAEIRHWTLQEQTASEGPEEGVRRILPVWEWQPWLQSPWNEAQSARQRGQGADDRWGEEGIVCRMSQEVWSPRDPRETGASLVLKISSFWLVGDKDGTLSLTINGTINIVFFFVHGPRQINVMYSIKRITEQCTFTRSLQQHFKSVTNQSSV